MRAILFKTDMGYESVEQIVAEVAKNFRGRVVQLEDVVATWKAKLRELMAQEGRVMARARGPRPTLGADDLEYTRQ